MTDLVPHDKGELDERRDAGAVVAACADVFTAQGVPLPARYRSIIGKLSKELLTDGFDYETLVVAAVTSLRRGEPHNLHHIATDLAMARAGQKMTRREYERALQDEMELGR